jgi:hypothetical protein
MTDAAVRAAKRLLKEIDNIAAKPAERIQASRAALDRFMGTPAQTVNLNTEHNLTNLSNDELHALAFGSN